MPRVSWCHLVNVCLNNLSQFFFFVVIFFQISPLNGPVEGGTLVTIEGSNLGLQRSDVEGKITIGRIPCKLVEYKVSNEIVCRTGSALGELDAPIVVGNNAGYTQSEVKFSYRVSSFHLFFFLSLGLVTLPITLGNQCDSVQNQGRRVMYEAIQVERPISDRTRISHGHGGLFGLFLFSPRKKCTQGEKLRVLSKSTRAFPIFKPGSPG